MRPGFEPGTSRLPVLSVTAAPLVGPELPGNDQLSEVFRITDVVVVGLNADCLCRT